MKKAQVSLQTTLSKIMGGNIGIPIAKTVVKCYDEIYFNTPHRTGNILGILYLKILTDNGAYNLKK